MIVIPGAASRDTCDGVTRRDLLKVGGSGILGLTVPPAPLAHTREPATTPRIATHESARVHAEPTGWF